MLRDWLELIRVPNVFTAMADVAMGFFFVTPVAAFDASAGLTLALLIAASSLLYSGGMVLNDVCDYEEDCRDRPERPLPSGRISLIAARRFGWGLLIGGVSVAILASLLTAREGPAGMAICLAILIVGYNNILKHTALGPIILGMCRMCNVILGMMATVDRRPDAGLLVAEVVGLYIVGVSVMARREAQQGRRAILLLGVVLMVSAVGVLWWLPVWRPILVPAAHWHGFIILMAILVAWRCYRALVDPSPAVIQQTVGQSLRALVVLDAAIVAAVAGIVPGVAVLLLLVSNLILSRWFYST